MHSFSAPIFLFEKVYCMSEQLSQASVPDMSTKETDSYASAHRPASDFKSRSDYLDHELTIMKPRRWRLNL
ncbi:MAG: DUF3360 family protein, partial [Reinekea sp.]|nr:DUF3360 family protein [Reinekea sp.]